MTSDSTDNFGYVGTDYSHIPVSGSYSTVQFPDGYTPTPKPDSNFKYDYDYDYEKLSGPRRDIETIRLMIKAQLPGTISALADHWVKVVQLLDTVQTAVVDNADSLHNGNKSGFGGWSSPAATEFLRWGPGATLYSIRQWIQAANANVRALRKLSDAVLQAHAEIDLAWQSYLDEARADKAKLMEGWGYDPSLLPVDQQKQLPGPAAQLMTQIYEHQTAIWRKWSVKAQGIAYELSQKYYAQLEGDLIAGRGTRFEGPGNAVVDNPILAQMRPPAGAPPPGAPAAAPAASPPPAAPAVAPPAGPPPAKPPGPTNPTSGTQSPPAAPPPALDPAQIPAPLPLGELALSPATARLLGLAPPTATTSAAQPAARPGSFGAIPRTPATGPGVLRSGAPARPGPTPPGGVGRTLSRPPGGRSPLGETPLNRGRRAVPADPADGRSNQVGEATEEPFDHQPGATSPSVFSGRRTTGVPEHETRPAAGAPARPGTAPSIVGRARAAGASPDPADETREPTEPGATRPVLGSPVADRARTPTATPEQPESAQIRKARPAGRPAAGPGELASRHRTRPDANRDDTLANAEFDEAGTVVGDEAWSVQSPGGSLLTGHAEQPAYEAEHRPVLGGGTS